MHCVYVQITNSVSPFNTPISLLSQSSPMDEAQKEHPLITATNVGHPEVKQEIEAFFRKVRHELPTSVHSCSKTEMWQNITKAFQV